MSNRRSILMLVAGIALLVAVHFAVDCTRGVQEGVARRTVLLDPSAAVTGVEVMRRGEPPTALVRTNDEWRLIAPFQGSADEQTVKRILDALSFTPISDALADAELLKMGQYRANYSLEPPLLSVKVTGAGCDETISFGIPTPNADGIYASIAGVDAVFIVPPEVMSAVDLSADSFRRRTLFLASPTTITAFDVKRGTGSVTTFVRDGDGWKTAEGPASAAKVKAFLSELTATEAIGFVWPVGASNETAVASSSLLAGYGLDPESSVTVTLKTVDGAVGQASFGKDAGDGLVYALAQNGGAVVTMSAALKDVVAQETALFSDPRLFPLEARKVTAFTVVDDDVSYALSRGADGGWRLESPIFAPADKSAVESLLARLLALSPADADASGVSVAFSSDAKPVRVSRKSALGDGSFEQLRSTEVVKIDPTLVKRLVRTFGGKPVTIAYARDRRVWDVETEGASGSVDDKAVETVLSAINPLTAKRVEKLKVKAEDLAGYGLDHPFMTLAVDQDRDDVVRRNLMIGAPTDGGRFATVGASDAVFVLSSETVSKLTLPLLTE